MVPLLLGNLGRASQNQSHKDPQGLYKQQRRGRQLLDHKGNVFRRGDTFSPPKSALASNQNTRIRLIIPNHVLKIRASAKAILHTKLCPSLGLLLGGYLGNQRRKLEYNYMLHPLKSIYVKILSIGRKARFSCKKIFFHCYLIYEIK